MAIENEKELVEIFNKFWDDCASKDANIDNWKGYKNGSEVVYFLQNRTPKTKELQECSGYRRTKAVWDNAHEKDKDGEQGESKEFELDESQVVWNRITSVVGGPLGYGINFYVEIRNWPIEWLSESNKHTRQYVLNNIDKSKGLSNIIDTARKKVGEQEEADKKKKEEQQKAQTTDEPTEDKSVEEPEGKVGYVKVSKEGEGQEQQTQSNSRKVSRRSKERMERVVKEAATPGVDYIAPDNSRQVNVASDKTAIGLTNVNLNENETHSEMI